MMASYGSTSVISGAFVSDSFVCLSVVFAVGDGGKINRWRNSSITDAGNVYFLKPACSVIR